jgi:hypothetical protein
MNMAPTFAHCVWLSAPQGGAAPAARLSRFRGPCLRKYLRGSTGCRSF